MRSFSVFTFFSSLASLSALVAGIRSFELATVVQVLLSREVSKTYSPTNGVRGESMGSALLRSLEKTMRLIFSAFANESKRVLPPAIHRSPNLPSFTRNAP